MDKFYRSQKDSIVAGVCGGLGQYFNVDSTLVRLFFVFLSFYHLLGLWVYIVLTLITPRVSGDEEILKSPIPIRDNPQATRIAGGGLILLGVLALISNLPYSWLAWIRLEQLWPILLILVGVLMLARIFAMEDKNDVFK